MRCSRDCDPAKGGDSFLTTANPCSELFLPQAFASIEMSYMHPLPFSQGNLLTASEAEHRVKDLLLTMHTKIATSTHCRALPILGYGRYSGFTICLFGKSLMLRCRQH